MAGIDIHFDIQTAFCNLLKAKTFDGISSTNIKVRMLPKVSETLDAVPCILIAPYGNIDWAPVSFENSSTLAYYTEICLVGATNLDFSTKQEQHGGWRQIATRACLVGDMLTTTPTVEEIWRVELVRNATFDRSKLSQNYSYQSFVMKCDSQEARQG